MGMKVVCIRLAGSADESASAGGSWLTLDREYSVLSVAATPGGPVELQVLSDDERTPGWFNSAMFLVVDASFPPNWTMAIDEDGALEMTPARWAAPGFWGSFFDGEPTARRIYEEELPQLLA